MDGSKMRCLSRAAAGGAAGLLLVALYQGPLFAGGYSAPALCAPLIERVGLSWAIAVTCALAFALGAAAGVATLPFADSGRELVVRSLVHFAVTAALWSLLLGACFGVRGPMAWLVWLGALALLYALIWLGRWVGWYAEVAAIREKLGLAPGPSLFHWRETLPYVGFASLLCLALPLALQPLEEHQLPILSVLYAWLLLPAGGAVSGLSLGRRHGLCPLYPAACGLFMLVFALIARLCSDISLGILVPIAAVSALAGDLTGAARHRMKRKAGERT